MYRIRYTVSVYSAYIFGQCLGFLPLCGYPRSIIFAAFVGPRCTLDRTRYHSLVFIVGSRGWTRIGRTNGFASVMVFLDESQDNRYFVLGAAVTINAHLGQVVVTQTRKVLGSQGRLIPEFHESALNQVNPHAIRSSTTWCMSIFANEVTGSSART